MFYIFFVSSLLDQPELILELFQEKRAGVRVVLNGSYNRYLITGTASSEWIRIKIQRVLVLSADGDRLYSRALLPGIIIPYRQFSLQFILRCLWLYYNHRNVSRICSDAGIDRRQLFEWVHLVEEGSDITDFLKSSQMETISGSSSGFLSNAFKDPFSENLKMLYTRFALSPLKWQPIFPAYPSAL